MEEVIWQRSRMSILLCFSEDRHDYIIFESHGNNHAILIQCLLPSGIEFTSLEVPPERTFGYQRCLDNESGEETNFGIVSNVYNKVLLIAVSGAGFNNIREEQLNKFVSENGGVWRYHNYGVGSINRKALNNIMTMIVNSTACSPQNPIKLIINLRDSQLLGPVLRDQYARQGVIFQVEYANSGVNHTAKWKDIKAKICKDVKKIAARIIFMDFEEEAEHRIGLILSKMDAYVQTEGLQLKMPQKAMKSASQKKLAIS